MSPPHQSGSAGDPPARSHGGSCEVVRLELPAEPASVAIVHRAMAAGQSDGRRDDLGVAVSDACTNVIGHAYPNRTGVIDVSAATSVDALDIVVSGTGEGDRGGYSGSGIGSKLMERSSDLLEIESVLGRGHRVRLSFARG